MPVELVGATGINTLKRRLRTLYQQEPQIDVWPEIAKVTQELHKNGWSIIVCPVVHTGYKSRIVFEQISQEE